MPGKLSLIVLVVFVLTGCSIIKNSTGKGSVAGDDGAFNIPKQVPFKTLFIPRAQIDLNIDGKEETLIATIKYNEGTWLFSIRSEDGIEVARAKVSKDTLLVNDRLNRKIYHGNPDNIRSTYGFGQQDLSLLLGTVQTDLLISSRTDCINELVRINGVSGGFDFIMSFRCSTSVLEEVVSDYKGVPGGFFVKYLKYKNYDSVELPTLIEVKVPEEGISLVIRIFDHKINENVSTDFIPGNNYEKVLIR